MDLVYFLKKRDNLFLRETFSPFSLFSPFFSAFIILRVYYIILLAVRITINFMGNVFDKLLTSLCTLLGEMYFCDKWSRKLVLMSGFLIKAENADVRKYVTYHIRFCISFHSDTFGWVIKRHINRINEHHVTCFLILCCKIYFAK